MNFFAWIREGVRQAVLLGVADAVDNLGTPPEAGDYKQHIAEAIQSSPQAIASRRLTKTGSRRKKLGRSLEQIQAVGMEKAEGAA
ncbi:MAG: hypothetical protein D6741_17355 [Planctomycetota bacterium]|nr:MAG: hypothetical protein D6741_17355 [Planctomycetota bacterium]